MTVDEFIETLKKYHTEINCDKYKNCEGCPLISVTDYEGSICTILDELSIMLNRQDIT